jgi:hypothetical protein
LANKPSRRSATTSALDLVRSGVDGAGQRELEPSLPPAVELGFRLEQRQRRLVQPDDTLQALDGGDA